LPSGIILKGIGGFYYVLHEGEIFECKARGVFRKNEIVPLPGDRIIFSIIDNKTGDDKKAGKDGTYRTGFIEKILPRDSELVRPAIANVDQMVAVIAVCSPEPDFMLLDKLLVSAGIKNISAVICINKIDLDPGKEYQKMLSSYASAGYKIIATSSKTEEGLPELIESLKGRMSVFAGQSGVGKSTLTNIIMKESIMKTGDISQKISRGKHTTRHAECIPLKIGGFLADTPGFSSFDVDRLKPSDLQIYYPEFVDLAVNCRFKGCNHVSEPGCAVKEAVEAGNVGRDRYLRYVELFKDIKESYDMRFKK